MIDLLPLAQSVGFAECHVLTNEKFTRYERRLLDGVLASAGRRLCVDPRETYPWSNALVLLLYAYRPYAPALHVSGNYPSSNAAYHAVKTLLPLLAEHGVRAERVYVPVRELALRSGVGVGLKNGLTAYGRLGTRVAVQTLIADIPNVAYTPPRYDAPFNRACEGCKRCEAACPSGAITDAGYDVSKCARAYMGKETMPAWAMEKIDSLLGCELCQFACPLNAGISYDENLPDAFSLERILRGEIRPALEMVGNNLNSGGRIVCQAMALAARQGRTDLLPLIRAWADDPREQVRSAMNYAISLLQAGA